MFSALAAHTTPDRFGVLSRRTFTNIPNQPVTYLLLLMKLVLFFLHLESRCLALVGVLLRSHF